MRKGGTAMEAALWLTRRRSFRVLSAAALLYLLFLDFQFPFLSDVATPVASRRGYLGGAAHRALHPLDSEEETLEKGAPVRPDKLPFRVAPLITPTSAAAPRRRRSRLEVSGLVFGGGGGNRSELHKAAGEAWKAGGELFGELRAGRLAGSAAEEKNRTEEACPHSILLPGKEFQERGRLMVLPCGLTLGSHVTLVGRPRMAHAEYDPKISEPKEGEQGVLVSQFMMELQGLRAVDGEDPPRILHFNPRLKGDWSGRPVIEQNTCYRMQWGTALRCEGWKSRADEETVDGLVKCEKWIRDDDDHSEESKTTWWLSRLIGRTKKVSVDWPYPFVEDKLFVLTLSAGLEGYHVHVDGRHITSFPYRTGFVLEDATGLSLNGDLDVQSVFAASLPTSHPSFAPQKHLEMTSRWQAPPLPDGPVELFIGILSAGNHFAERMAVRKSWMRSIRKSQNVVARFFVAMHARKEVNVELKREAEFFGDIVIVPFMDSYDLVVLKTVAICEYGVHSVSARYIMKCDDDTFVRIDSVLNEVKKVPSDKSLYVGNINYYHKPLRYGKWAVTYEEWPEEDYPPYANGPGYIVSSDIAHFIVSEFERHTLRVTVMDYNLSLATKVGLKINAGNILHTDECSRGIEREINIDGLSRTWKHIHDTIRNLELFKMEDVSMGMWVEQFNSTKPVEYIHTVKFCQFGCIDDYYTAHYQSPRQMICMWDKLQKGNPQCCNMR